MALLGVVAGSVAMVSSTSARAFSTGTIIANVDSQAKRALDRICDLIKVSSLDNVSPTPAAPLHTLQVDYLQGVGFLNEAIVWGDPQRIEFQYSPGEINDGLDNDGNGFIDEGQVVRIENPGLANERTITLCRRVSEYLEGEIPNGLDDNGNGLIDERGLSFDFDGDGVTVRLTIQQADTRGIPITRTVEKRVSFRNKGS